MNWYSNTGQRSEATSNHVLEVELSRKDMGIGKEVCVRMLRYYQECRNEDTYLNLIDSEARKREQ